jgi:ribose transport system substrate-binding protein
MMNESPKALFRISILLFLSLTLLTCTSRKEEGSSKQKTVGVALLNRVHVFYKDLEEGIREEAAAKGFRLVVTSADMDLGKQIPQVEDFVTQKVDAIVVCPVDSKGIGNAIKAANRASIPVFTADIAADEGEVVSHIASDNVAGGRLAGEYLGKALKGKGKIAIINHPVVTSVLDRVKGFREALAKFPGITVVSDVDGDAVRDRAMQVSSDILQGHPDLSGVFGINDDSALGALDAAETFNRRKLVIVGYDATPPAVKAILEDTPLKADVIQYPKKIGVATIDAIDRYFHGEKMPSVIAVEVGIVDKTTASAVPSQ